MKAIITAIFLTFSFAAFTPFSSFSDEVTIVKNTDMEEVEELIETYKSEINKAIADLKDETGQEATMIRQSLEATSQQLDMVTSQLAAQDWNTISSQYRAAMMSQGEMSEAEVDEALKEMRAEWTRGLAEAKENLQENLDQFRESLKQFKNR
ncbi:MAG: hypothetical protein Kapaf2KO_06610 [Candidatus Kapaibacteriales bacterium]